MKKEDKAMEKREDMIQWIKGHKKQLIIAGISTGTLILIILGVKNWDKNKAIWDLLRGVMELPATNGTVEAARIIEEHPSSSAPEIVSSVISNTEPIPFEVCRHIRNLPEGWHPSPEKVAEAMKYNINLMEGQTWVDSYLKGGVA